MTFNDHSYDLVYSNSVIEHVGDLEKQRKFASESRRVGVDLRVQTPARECPIEPHLLLPFVHWFSDKIRCGLGVPLSPRSWLFRENGVRKMAEETRLLSYREMVDLFPDCEIKVERIAGFFPKSYIAVRRLKRMNGREQD